MRRLSFILHTMLASAALIQALAPGCPCRWFAAPRAITAGRPCQIGSGQCCGHSHREPSEESDERDDQAPEPVPCECPHHDGGNVLTAFDSPPLRCTPWASNVGEQASGDRPLLTAMILQIGITKPLHPSAQIGMRLQV